VVLLEHIKLRVEMIATKLELCRDLARQLAALIAGEPDPIANAANTAALIYHGLPNLNWAGFLFPQRLRAGARAVPG
jgi:L-methionine (R)-S-oxide reductase